MKINSTATLENIRMVYPSAAQFARECGVTTRFVYLVLRGERNGQAILTRLEDEGLLVQETSGDGSDDCNLAAISSH